MANEHDVPAASPSPTASLAASSAVVPEAVLDVRVLLLDDISTNPRQPRTEFDADAIEELASSIREVGVLQPIVVRRHPDDPGRYELVMGERRWRASRLADLDTVPAIVRETTDGQMLREALLENLQRVQLNPLEEAAAYQQMLSDFDATHEELAASVGKSRSHVSHTVSLLKLPSAVQRRVAAGVITAGHAKALVSVKEPTACARLAERVIAEGLSVRATEEIIMLGDLPGDGPAFRPQRARAVTAPELAEAAESLGDLLDTRVRIEAGKSKGKIVVEFSDTDDMRRILDMFRPGADPSH